MTVSPAAAILLASVLALAFLHFVMVLALYATRIPAMLQMKMSARRVAEPGGRESLPAWARNVAANYNNLSEAPTAFYAVVITIVLLGQADMIFAACAWAYVALRYIHSALQATANVIIIRFSLFVLSWAVLGTMTIRSACLLLIG